MDTHSTTTKSQEKPKRKNGHKICGCIYIKRKWRVYLASVINVPSFSTQFITKKAEEEHEQDNTIREKEEHELLERKKAFLNSKFSHRKDFYDYLDHCDSCIKNCDYAMELTPKLVAVLMTILSTLQTLAIQSNLSRIADIINYTMTALSVSVLLINAVSGTVIRKLYQTSLETCRKEFDAEFWAKKYDSYAGDKDDIEHKIWKKKKDSHSATTTPNANGSSPGNGSMEEP